VLPDVAEPDDARVVAIPTPRRHRRQRQRQRQRRRVLVLAAGLVVGVGVALAVGLGADKDERSPSRRGTAAPSQAGAGSLPALKPLAGLPQVGAVLGRSSAPAMLEVYADVASPGFARFDRRVLELLIKRYVRPGRLAIALRTLPSASREELAPGSAHLAQAAGLQTRLWQFARALSVQPRPARLEPIVRSIPGLDRVELLADSRSARVRQAVARSVRLAAEAQALRPPAFRLTVGARTRRIAPGLPPQAFAEAIEAALTDVRGSVSDIQ
jgi:hypothetical protein